MEQEREENLELTEDKKKKSKGGRVIALVIIIILIAFLFAIVQLCRTPNKEKIVTKKAPVVEAITKDEIVGPKEGRQHVYIRQLEKNPGLVNEDPRLKKYAYKGDPSDKKKLHEWAGKVAHWISLLNGEIDQKFGAEVWVKTPNKVAYKLTKVSDGKVEIQVHTADENGKFPANMANYSRPFIVDVQKLAKDFSSAQFRGDIPNGLLAHERIYLGQPG